VALDAAAVEAVAGRAALPLQAVRTAEAALGAD
jgi:hypothetical protein